jgi:hypothetical protein
MTLRVIGIGYRLFGAEFVPWLNRYIEVYLSQARPVLLGSRPPTNAL